MASQPAEPLTASPYSGEPERLREQQRSSQRLQLEALAQAKPAEPLDKAALEKLLAPVFEVSREAQTVAAPKVAVSTVAAELPKVAVKPAPAPAPNPVEISPVAAAVSNAQALKPLAAAEVLSSTAPQTQTGATPPSITKDLQEQLDDEFQVLFFKVAGLTLAVPLVSLGGIVRVERINHIFGRPSWFLGVQTHRDAQLNLVDTCAWVMPEKYDEKLAQSVNYQYLVLLEDSNWGLACESLVNAVRIKQSEVNWRTSAGKRPWLAGVVKEQMCGILNVTALIQLLDAGLGCQDPIN
nr:chemotaxis protein CheW [Shewanella jiangmenensis]